MIIEVTTQYLITSICVGLIIFCSGIMAGLRWKKWELERKE